MEMRWRNICVQGAMLGLLLLCFSLLVSAQTLDPLEVSALKAIRRKLKDPYKNLWNWKKKDPCENEWTGVICTEDDDQDAYLHVQELRLLNLNLSGKLSPRIGNLPYLTILNFMWNNISGSIPKEIGNLTNLQQLLLNGNQISGPLPEELGYLPKLVMFQVDQNHISGSIPKSFSKLKKVQHFHFNNNSLSGQIPSELSEIPEIIHILLDNNNLSGYLPPELGQIEKLRILQLDNNNFGGSIIPDSYATMPKLVKLTLRNCNLQGKVPDFSRIPGLLYLDLSSNKLDGNIPTNRFPVNITTIDLSGNMLIGSIPSNFSGLPELQILSLQHNRLTGDVPSTIWENMTFSSADATLTLNFENNFLQNISGSLNHPSNVTILLAGNPVCESANELKITQFCGLGDGDLVEPPGNSSSSQDECEPQICVAELFFEYAPDYPSCFCAAPIEVWFRLRSPSMTNFRPFVDFFKAYLTSDLGMEIYQLVVDGFDWQRGPKLILHLKFFPKFSNDSHIFSTNETRHLIEKFTKNDIHLDNFFGPYDLLNFNLGHYYNRTGMPPESGMSKGIIAAIVLGSISCAATLLFAIVFIYNKTHPTFQRKVSKNQPFPKNPIKFEGVRGFSFQELETATDSFNITTQVGQGGYGKVYKGILADGTIVAIKRAQQGSMQGEKEFYTEIELLSRVHHRNLVSLAGYCDEEDEQMLVYEFMPNGSLQSLLSARFQSSLAFSMRLRIASDSAKGILYLHTEADPPIIHRDIKANNILLDSKFTAKVSDFGISKLAPVSDGKGVGIEQISTVVKGTPGYLDPEYFFTNKLTERSDVYSLGIVFLELLTGKPPISHGRNIVREVITACQSGEMLSIVDKNMGPYDPECLKKFMELALKCSQEVTSARPSMLEVVRELENITSMLPESDSSIPSEIDGSSSSGIPSGYQPTPLYYSEGNGMNTNNNLFSNVYTGSDLVSGVIPTIKPR
nr:probable LRR receptor-like serine/threonine-protein kinase At1g06840 [Ziziphus jujuba var. spinosa]